MHVAATAHSPVPSHWRTRDVGQLHTLRTDLAVDHLIATGRIYGKRDGYSSLSDALAGLAEVTAGEKRRAAGVFELDGRYYGRALNHMTVTSFGQPVFEKPHAFHLERPENPILGTVVNARGGLRAVIDGERVLRDFISFE